MSVISQIDADLKQALLSGDKTKATTLRGLRSAFIYEAVSLGVKDEGLNDEQAQKVLAREAKKRVEAAEAYQTAGSKDRAEAELNEKAVIEVYLPAQASEVEISAVVDEEFAKLESPSAQDMGKIIAAVRAKLGASADGATIARLVKDKIE